MGPDRTAAVGTVSYREFLGASVRYGVRAGAADIAVDCPFRAGDTLHEVGAAVTIAIATQSVRFLSD
jgi:iron(III) transport system ATP-binding protein